MTDLWKAGGSDENQRPTFWLRTQPVQDFIDHIAVTEKRDHNHLIQITRGRNGSTFAHCRLPSHTRST